jgi:peptidoglycan/LPS O-acetylase OafA/YrhL
MHEENNFDLLRVSAASLVLISHQFALVGLQEPLIGTFHSIGGLGVTIFFTLSGFLVADSWLRDPHPGRFLAKRILRIWPGLACVTVLAALVLGPAVSTLPIREYLAHAQVAEYFASLYMRIRHYLPGVFEGNVRTSVNGSLWTLPIEVRWYLILLLLGLAGILRRRAVLLCATLALAVFVFAVQDAEHGGRRSFSFEFGAFFMYGMCLQCYRDVLKARPMTLLLLACAAGALLYAAGYAYAGLFVVLPLAIVLFGTASTPVLRRAGRFGDLSYGVYIYAFPVQQTVISLGASRWPVWQALAVCASATFVLAFASWHLVERPALGLKRHLEFGRSRLQPLQDAIHRS